MYNFDILFGMGIRNVFNMVMEIKKTHS